MTAIQKGLAKRFEPSPDSLPILQGKVIAVNMAQMRVDVALERGGILRDVPVMAPVAGTREGRAYIAAITNASNSVDTGTRVVDSMRRSKDRDTFCVIAWLGGSSLRPVVLGFLFPEQFEGSFDAVDVEKYRNGAYRLVDDTGWEVVMPNGTFIRVGQGSTRHATSGGNVDAATVPFSDSAGTANVPNDITIHHSSGASIHIDTAGNIILTAAGGSSINVLTHTHTDPQGGSTGGPV